MALFNIEYWALNAFSLNWLVVKLVKFFAYNYKSLCYVDHDKVKTLFLCMQSILIFGNQIIYVGS